MAAGGKFLSCLLAVLSALLTPGYGGYRQIDLTQVSGVSCNVSSKFNNISDCRAAINGKTGTTYLEGMNCVYTKGEPDQYWLLNLGKPRNIHRITIYPETFESGKFMIRTAVLVDEVEIGQLHRVTPITTPQVITTNLPVRGQIIRITRPDMYTGLCELQLEECTADTYGADCSRPCGGGCNENGGDTTCDSINGTCFAGCNGTRWGSDCSLPCGQCGGDGSCYALTGHCVSGCVEGFGGDTCTLKLASDDTQDGGNLAGPLVAGLLGAGALIGIAILLAAFINRRRRSRDTSNSADTDGAHFSSGNAPIEDVTEGDKPETETPGNESNYAQLEKYENPDDIRPYSMLQDGGKLPNIQSDQETALCQNTTVSKN